jgi:uncharacterized protein (DUF1810 family)
LADHYNLRRFVEAQDPCYDRALAELRQGQKVGHWMWFIFPQIRGLGFSPMSQLYAISSLDEARASLRHPVLGPRLLECTNAVNQLRGRSSTDVFGHPDDLKFRSSMTLFAEAAPTEMAFADALTQYFEGERDDRTIKILGKILGAQGS